jgi:hypothetical protein
MITKRPVHEPTQACAREHCYSHNVDEPTPERYYLACGECMHLFPTARSLRRADRRLRAGFLVDWTWPRWQRALAWPPAYLAQLLFGFRRASRIWVCPFCAHDL